MSVYAQFYLSSRRSVARLECLEISHPDFSKTYYIVRNATNGVTVTHPEEGGANHFYEYWPLKIDRSGAQDDLDSTLNIQLGDLGEIIGFEADNVRAAGSFHIKPTVKMRIYRSDALGGPIWGPFTYEAGSFAMTKEGCAFTASAPQLNVTSNGARYTIDRFPMLKGFL